MLNRCLFAILLMVCPLPVYAQFIEAKPIGFIPKAIVDEISNSTEIELAIDSESGMANTLTRKVTGKPVVTIASMIKRDLLEDDDFLALVIGRYRLVLRLDENSWTSPPITLEVELPPSKQYHELYTGTIDGLPNHLQRQGNKRILQDVQINGLKVSHGIFYYHLSILGVNILMGHERVARANVVRQNYCNNILRRLLVDDLDLRFDPATPRNGDDLQLIQLDRWGVDASTEFATMDNDHLINWVPVSSALSVGDHVLSKLIRSYDFFGETIHYLSADVKLRLYSAIEKKGLDDEYLLRIERGEQSNDVISSALVIESEDTTLLIRHTGGFTTTIYDGSVYQLGASYNASVHGPIQEIQTLLGEDANDFVFVDFFDRHKGLEFIYNGLQYRITYGIKSSYRYIHSIEILPNEFSDQHLILNFAYVKPSISKWMSAGSLE